MFLISRRATFLACLLLLLAWPPLFGQNIPGLAGYYSFQGTLADVSGTTANEGLPVGTAEYGCGLLTGTGPGNALFLGTSLSSFAVTGPLVEEFNDEDISISFFINPTGSDPIQNIITKRGSTCSPDSSLSIQYLPASREIRARFTEVTDKQIGLSAELPPNQCWNHVLIVREENRIRMYFNGILVDEGATVGVIDISNDGDLVVGDADCAAVGESPFTGRLDELIFFSRALTLEQAAGLDIFPDRILTPDSQLFLGESIQVEVGPLCGTNVSWSPTTGVNQPNSPEPLITPQQPGPVSYVMTVTDPQTGCVSMDTLNLQVINPDDLDCNKLFMPTAFTPNGDGTNDGYGISNPFAVQELVSFEIFDRWGSRVFTTQDPFERWDGSFKGLPMNPGVLLYRLVSVCNGRENLKTGNVTLLR